jgi:tripartite-type tricarboxylate transporter receptor subunit TctC
MARLVAQKLTDGLKHQAYVENRAGGGGRLGTDYVAKAAPDGHTLLVTGSGSMILATAMYEKLSYNIQRDFASVTMLVLSPAVLVMHPTVPVQTVRQLVALGRSNANLLNYASPGAGAMGHLAGELLQSIARIKITHVPYKGTSPAMMSVLAGETDLAFSNFLPAVPAIKAGRLRAIAVTSSKRSTMFPHIPTIAESGVAGYEAASYYGVLAPASVPREIVERLNTILTTSLQASETRRSLESDGSLILASTPAEMSRLIQIETEKWSKIIKAAGIKPE